MSRSDRARAQGRGPSAQTPKRALYLFMEGEVTEREYLEGVYDPGKVQLHFKFMGGAPKTVVERALGSLRPTARSGSKKEAKRKGQAPSSSKAAPPSQTWCVFDRDDHAHVPQALQEARAGGLRVAYSNPCFELWLLLHFQPNPGAHHRHHLQRELARLMPGYDPDDHKHLDFSRLAGGVEDAIKRAEQMLTQAQALQGFDHEHNPQTSVHELVRELR